MLKQAELLFDWINWPSLLSRLKARTDVQDLVRYLHANYTVGAYLDSHCLKRRIRKVSNFAIYAALVITLFQMRILHLNYALQITQV